MSPIAGAGGGDISKSAIRDPVVWAALTGTTGDDDVASYTDSMRGFGRTDAQALDDIWWLLVKGNPITWLHRTLTQLGVDVRADDVDEQQIGTAIPAAQAQAVAHELARRLQS